MIDVHTQIHTRALCFIVGDTVNTRGETKNGRHVGDVVGGDGLSSELTVILTTSFTAACPATKLIEATVSSFGLSAASPRRLVVVADGYRVSSRRRTKAAAP